MKRPETADYAIGRRAGASVAEAEQAIGVATRFVDSVARLLSAGEG